MFILRSLKTQVGIDCAGERNCAVLYPLARSSSDVSYFMLSKICSPATLVAAGRVGVELRKNTLQNLCPNSDDSSSKLNVTECDFAPKPVTLYYESSRLFMLSLHGAMK